MTHELYGTDLSCQPSAERATHRIQRLPTETWTIFFGPHTLGLSIFPDKSEEQVVLHNQSS